MKQLTRPLIAALLALPALTGAAQAEDSFKYGTVALKGDAGIVMMATQDQFDAAHGLDIEPVSMKGDAILLKALIAGELDAYIGNPGGPMLAASKGADVKVIACPWPGLTYALYTKPEIKSVADLKGGSIGVSAPGSLPDLFARAVVRSAGLTEKDVKITVAGSDAERIGAVAAGIITAAPSSSEFQAKAPELGLKMLVHARDVTPDYMRFCIMTTGRKIASERDQLTRFLEAQMQAFDYALSHKSETLALSYEMNHSSPETDKSPEFIYDEVHDYGAIAPKMPVDMKKLDWMRDLLTESGNLAAGFDPAKMVDTSILEAAQAQVSAAQ